MAFVARNCFCCLGRAWWIASSLIFFPFFQSLLHAQAIPEPAGQTISTSRQFTITGADRQARSRMASLAEDVRSVWAAALGLSPSWEFPILINFPEESRRRVRQSVALQVLAGDGDTLAFQLTIWDPALIGQPEMAQWILQALAAEYTARYFRPAVNRPFRLAPEWFIQAITQQWLTRRSPPALQLLEGLLNSPRPPTVAGVIRQQAFSGSSAELVTYRLLAQGLLQTLSEAPEGKAGLRELVGRLGEREMDLTAILAAFPSLENADRLERQWTLTLARRAVTTRTHLLSFAETVRELQKILSLESELPVKRNEVEALQGPLALLGIAREQGGAHRLGGIVAELMQLEVRTHPLFHPVVREYREICHQLMRRPRSRMRERIEKNMELTDQLRQLGESISEALHLYEVNSPAPVSRPASRSTAPPISTAWEPAPRRDAITRALDLFEEKNRTGK